MRGTAEEGFEFAGKLSKAASEDMDESVGTNDCDRAELIDCASVRELAGEVDKVLACWVSLLTEPD